MYKKLISIMVLILVFTLSGIAGCTSKKPKNETISIKYVGNSCFLIEFPDGTKLVSDPFGTKYAGSFAGFPKMTANFITLSHTHEDHIAGAREIEGNPLIIRPVKDIQTTTVGSIKITGYPSKHVANMGDNTIFVYEANGLKIVHMGETSSIESEEARNAVKDADVLLVYAGQYDKIKNAEIFKDVSELNVKVMIPQHYTIDPKKPWYGAPSEEDIKKDVPEGYKIEDVNEFKVTMNMEKQFIFLKPIGADK